MNRFSDRLYELLPAVYRLRDADQGNTLKAFLDVIAEQVGLVEDDIGQLYDDWFIETCAEWLVPYIGDLLGVRGLHQTEAGFTQRAYVANTLAYRRRKGTATVLEQVARDTTLWPARAVEFFQLLETTQYINHLRPANLRTPDLRQQNALELLDGPFDTIAHTADVRRIGSRRGKHNIPNVGIHLWRLRSYILENVELFPSSGASDGRFTFSPLGNSAPLFNRPRTETTITHLAEEADVPHAIRPAAFYLDLQDYLEHNLALDAAKRAKKGTNYGENASLYVKYRLPPPEDEEEKTVRPEDVVSMDLSSWARPPARVRGELTVALPTAISLTAPLAADTPAVNVTFGSEGPYPAVLTALPTNPAEAAEQLTFAIQRAHDSPAFLRAQVVVVDNRLLVLPGEPGLTVAFETTIGDTKTRDELNLNNLTTVDAALSSLLKPFPKLTIGKMNLTIAGVGPHEIALSPLPVDLTTASERLQESIRLADTDPAFQEARVLIMDDRLLVIPGLAAGASSGGPVTFTVQKVEEGSDQVPDLQTVYLLGLQDRVGIDVRLGRIAFPLDAAVDQVRADFSYGFSGDLGGGPYDRRWIRQPGEALPTAYQNSVAEPTGLDKYLSVVAPTPTSLIPISDALGKWEDAERPHTVIEICDNGIYTENLDIIMGPNDLVIQARNKNRPVLFGDVSITGTGGGRLTLNGLLIAGGVSIDKPESLRQLDIVHTTLIPGGGLNSDGQALDPDSPSLQFKTEGSKLAVNLCRSISGPIYLPDDITSLNVQDCILESPLRDQPAWVSSVVVSGPVTHVSIPILPLPQMTITIGEEGPYALRLRRPPGKPVGQTLTLAELAACLERAIQGAHRSQTFEQAQVFWRKNVLIIRPGIPASIRFAALGSNSMIHDLGLDSGHIAERMALVSGPIHFPLEASNPALKLTLGTETQSIYLSPPATKAQVRSVLEQAIRDASPNAAFKNARVAFHADEDQLVIVPGQADLVPLFRATPDDQKTLQELALSSDNFAIAASLTGEQPAPPTSLVRTTVLGQVHVKELSLASETIFERLLCADRRQSGCVRFSFVPDGSRTPRRYRCQPELETATQLEAQQLASKFAEDSLRQRILDWLKPSFTSTQYGHPAYAQLSLSCPLQIRTGAEDGGEMGAFYFLKQPQRESNLLASLDEYLRFGLEAGIFYET